MTYSEQWDLETIFKGGLASPALENRLQVTGNLCLMNQPLNKCRPSRCNYNKLNPG